jgi:hypothetical protein
MLGMLARLIAGKSTAVNGEVITLALSAPKPVVLIGGHAHAIRRAVTHAEAGSLRR